MTSGDLHASPYVILSNLISPLLGGSDKNWVMVMRYDKTVNIINCTTTFMYGMLFLLNFDASNIRSFEIPRCYDFLSS